ncbi:MAG: VWA domain-containing protein [Verrucomicrobiota bacterium]
MNFDQPLWLLLLLVLAPGVIAFLHWGARKRRESLARVVAPRLHEQLLASVDFVRRRRKQFLMLLALILVLTALARPMSGNLEVRVELPGIDYFIALDVSKSMLAEDAGGTNRLTAAKRALANLLDRPSGDRVGLIAFAGDAFLISPISQDHGAIDRSLAALTTTSVSKPGTDLAAAIKLAAESFESKQEAGKAILLVTDGEELQGDAILAARDAAAQKISVCTVGVGSSAGARLPERTWGQLKYGRNEFGHDVVSRMNERVLQQVAAAGHGAYAHLENDANSLLELYEQHPKVLPKGSHVRKSQDQQELFQWPLALGLLLLLGEMLISERKRQPLGNS